MRHFPTAEGHYQWLRDKKKHKIMCGHVTLLLTLNCLQEWFMKLLGVAYINQTIPL